MRPGVQIVLKPAESTPLCAIETFKILEEAAIPAGVANLLTSFDPKPIGEEFLANPKVRKMTFTGSTEVGKHLAKGAAEQMKRISLSWAGMHRLSFLRMPTRFMRPREPCWLNF